MLNIAKKYHQLFAFNILPLINKAPAGDWSQYQDKLMSAEDLSSFKWKNIHGIGAVCGISNLRCLDFDSVNDFRIVQQFLRKLGLPAEYKWTVASGSGKGYHIWFCCNDDSIITRTLEGQKSFYRLQLQDAGLCDHIELRWKNCQTVLPPSLHSSGKKYKFHFLQEDHFPKMPPSNVPVEKLISSLTAHCILANNSAKANTPAKKQNSGMTEGIKKSYNHLSAGADTDIQPPVRRGEYNHPNIQAYDEISLRTISEFLEGRVNAYDEWLHIGFALASLGENGRQYFLKISSNNPKYNDTEEQLNKKFDSLIKDYRGDIKIGTLYEIAKRYGYENTFKSFWKIQNNTAKISSSRLIEYLEGEGFAKMIINKGYIFIKDTANVISEETRVNIKDYVLNFVNESTGGHNRPLIKESLIRCANALFGDSSLECLRTLSPEFVTDAKDNVHFFFRNCYIELTKENMKVNQYSELKGKIWAKQITDHDFHFTQAKSEFQTLIERICRMDLGRINALRSAIGYLLVSYKDPTCAKAVIFTDEKLSESAFGRSGKGLVAKAVSKMKNVLHIDGKNFNFDKAFMFQSVDPDTQLIVFDDIRKKFSFEKLFSILTDGITIEKKNRNEHFIPFEKAPKILITTNYAVEGTDDSSLDRQFVVEFSDYYNAKHKPADEFRHLFFDEWNEEQWSAFYNYMADCCRYYLKHGLKPYEYVNLNRKKLIDSTSPDFEEFITAIPLNTEFNKKELFEQFKKEFEDYAKMHQSTFTNWIKIYAGLYNMEVKERRTGMERFIRISKVK